jgi:sigma-B regulation protein RsbU (phosphoserine phosphatase)
MLFRIEELLEQALLRGRDDLQVRFKELAGKISGAGDEEELEALLRSEFEAILDASSVTLVFADDSARAGRIAELLERIGEPVTKQDLFKSAEKGRLLGDDRPEEKSSKPSEKERAQGRRAEAAALIASDEVLVPILREHRCAEFVSLGEKTYGLRYSSGELAQLSVISNQIGVALDNIRLLRENVEKKLIEEELEIARRIQSRLLPPCSPAIPGFELSASTTPSRHVGGDYYDFDVVDGNALIIVVADVSGKGIPASLLMATLHAAVHSNADARKTPAAMVGRINTLLYDSTSPEEFATLFYGVVNLEDGVMRYSNAGHEFPFLVSPDGVQQIGESGIVAGCIESFPYEEYTCRIPPGGTVVLYTDGITDAPAASGENFGTDRLKRVLERDGSRSAGELCSSIISEVEKFAQEGANMDDLTLVALKRE